MECFQYSLKAEQKHVNDGSKKERKTKQKQKKPQRITKIRKARKL